MSPRDIKKLNELWFTEDADNEISKESSKSEEGSKIKVVHFGLL